MNAKTQLLPVTLIIQLHMPVKKICGSLAFWFENNHLKANPGKSYILLSNKRTEKLTNNDDLLTSSVEEKFLDITFDSGLKFEK